MGACGKIFPLPPNTVAFHRLPDSMTSCCFKDNTPDLHGRNLEPSRSLQTKPILSFLLFFWTQFFFFFFECLLCPFSSLKLVDFPNQSCPHLGTLAACYCVDFSLNCASARKGSFQLLHALLQQSCPHGIDQHVITHLKRHTTTWLPPGSSAGPC